MTSITQMRFKHRGIAGQLYLGREPHSKARPLAIVIPGLPYEPSIDYASEVLLASGFDVIKPQFYGTYDSDGSFSIASAEESLLNLTDVIASGYIYDSKASVNVPISSNISIIVAHSFGAFIALRRLARGLQTKSAVLYAPFLAFGGNAADFGVVANLSNFVTYIKHAMPHTIRMHDYSSWKLLFNGETTSVAIPKSNQLANTQIQLVIGLSDPSLDGPTIEKVAKEYLPEAVVDLLPGGHGLEVLLSPSHFTHDIA